MRCDAAWDGRNVQMRQKATKNNADISKDPETRIKVKVKVKVTLLQATKVQRWSRYIALLFL